MYILYMMHNIDAYRILLYGEKRALSQKIVHSNRYYFGVFEGYIILYYTVHVHACVKWQYFCQVPF